MFSISEISQKISGNITRELDLDEDKKAVINYGIFALIQIMLSIVSVIVFGAIFNVVVEALIISFVTSILRKSSGGVHASSPRVCIVIGTFTSVGMAKISKAIKLNFNFIFFSGIMIFIISYYLVYKLAPVDSLSKPIKKIEKRKKLKKNSLIILTIYLIIVTISAIMFIRLKNYNSIIYIDCIYLGVIWQVFSLTQYGHSILSNIDRMISFILNWIERRCKQ